MATLDANIYLFFFEGPPGTLNYVAPPASAAAPITVTDGDPLSTSFEPTDTITANGASRSYLGTREFDGEVFAFFSGASGEVYAYSIVPDPDSFLSTASISGFDLSELENTSGADVSTLCFGAGTQIATPEGETTVETLGIGDLILTADGRAVPVKWIGRQTVLAAFAGERACPVRVAAGALGDGLPHTDLLLTADHALILDGLAINAGALVNGITITLDPAPARATYYHVETEDHDVILANGTPAETFIDYVGRQAFDNHAEYIALYGDARIITEMPLPRISTARLVPPALRARLAGDAAA